ncbi:MAG: hypothetical protein DMG70_05875 [Acidobacteria bacterium]|nr:MAG: hypothetical protein DMG70_05875 [Acidobacteriota bacterium]
MALEGYKSNHNVVYSSKYHCVWTPKYRRAVRVGPRAKRCEQVLTVDKWQKISCRNHGFGNHARPRTRAGRSRPAVGYPSVG